ncbi:MAG: hypothetical protein ABIS84_07410 [Arachnia sp.]
MSQQQPQILWLIPHTHWDREWYEPHDVFRARLVVMLDDLLDVLEGEPEYKFTLDGQSAALEDYLEIRPERLEQVRAAVGRGQLAVGPFQILLDEFCCDGETIVRNLEHGIRAARRVGTEMRVGYLPDMFGHAAQMPQILSGFGIRDASLWRGVPAFVDEHAFVWEALDGSQVRVEYQWDGYGNALKLFEPLEKLPELVADYLSDNASWFRGEDVAGMFGTDHMAPRPDLMGILRQYRAQGHHSEVRVSTIEEVIDSRDHAPAALHQLLKVRGELRSHARGNLLPGVFSIRTNIKAAMARAERALTTAERIDAWAGGLCRTALLERGWGLVIESTAHDSVTGCGADSTADEVESRLNVAAHTARGAIDIALPILGDCARVGAVAVFNQSGWARAVQAELVVEMAADAPQERVQVLEELPTVIGDELVETVNLPRIIRRIHGQELFGKRIRSWQWDDDALVLEVAEHTDGDFDLSAFTSELTRRMTESAPDRLCRVITRVPRTCRVLVGGRAGGLSVLALGVDTAALPDAPVSVEPTVLRNSNITATVAADGTVRIEDRDSGCVVQGALRLVDEGDCGDAYNHGPVDVPPVSQPTVVEVQVLESGPVRGRLRIRRDFEMPASLGKDRRTRSQNHVTQRVDTLLELRAGERFLRVRVSLVNQAMDHRLRVLVPTAVRGVEESSSAGQYGVTTRGRTAEGGWGEFPLPTFPATRFVHAGRVGILLDKLTDYEVIDEVEGPDDIALTVVRSVGLMSVNIHPLRDEPAGSEVPTPGAQYIGVPVDLSFAVDLGSPGGWSGSDVVEHSDHFRLEPVVAPGRAQERTEQGAGSLVETRGVVALESLRRVGESLEARFVNYATVPQPLRAVATGRWWRTDLAGEEAGGDVDPWALDVGAGEILTLRGHR